MTHLAELPNANFCPQHLFLLIPKAEHKMDAVGTVGEWVGGGVVGAMVGLSVRCNTQRFCLTLHKQLANAGELHFFLVVAVPHKGAAPCAIAAIAHISVVRSRT